MMNENDEETTLAGGSIIEYDIDLGKRSDQEFELYGMKFEAQCIRLNIPEITKKYMVTIVCNENLHNNLWKCTGSFEIQDRIVPFVFDCYHKKLTFNDVLVDQPDCIILKTKLEEVVGIQLIPHFDFEVPGFSDVTFLIGEKCVYAHKSILATNSTYFSAMFLSSFAEKEMAEIRLENMNFDEFVIFLNAVYPTNFELTENNVECLLRIADMYHAERVLRKCGKFLETTKKVAMSKKLDYAERYRLGKLERTCILNLKSKDHVKNLFDEFPTKNKEEQLNCLSETMQSKILSRFVELPDSCFIIYRSSELTRKEDSFNTAEEKDYNKTQQKFDIWKDAVLKIDGKELRVNRAYLSVFSSYFRELFYEDVEKHVFDLKDVEFDDFLGFVDYVQEPDKIITDTVIDNITSLSVRYGVPYLVNRCKEYWNDAIEKSYRQPLDSVKRLLLNACDASEMFGFSETQERILSRIRDTKQMGTMMLWPELEALGPKSRLVILRCYFIFYWKSN